MQEERIRKSYELWLEKATRDPDIVRELKEMPEDRDKLMDAFYKNLTFGTGGLRGIIGAGTNRMNIHTVAQASQGLSGYVKKHVSKDKWSIAVSYDSRIKSNLFARISAGVFAANGITVYLYPELMPTPCLSYAVRALGCGAGIMVTASHNPSKYNGYKVYGADGCQITTAVAEDIQNEIEQLDMFEDILFVEYEAGIKEGNIRFIEDWVFTSYKDAVKKLSLADNDAITKRNEAIVFTPLNGTGLKPVMQVLKEAGYKSITIVKEQEAPDGNFPTCPCPNPEIREAMALGLEYAKENQAELLLATDPDCDRVGIAVKNRMGEYELLSGNETGILLFDYICHMRQKHGTMPEHPVLVKTIVTTDMAERIAVHYGVKIINVLTGFKYIGEQIGKLEQTGKLSSYLFGFEESYGYLSGSYVRDKDGVAGVFLICEMFTYYKSQEITLLDKLDELYQKYGYFRNTLHSYEFEGASGFLKMQEIMERLRGGISILGTKKIKECLDYNKGLNGLPKSDVVKLVTEDGCSVVIRPSGTEPKLKIYVSVSGSDRKSAKETEKLLAANLNEYIK